MRVLPENFAGFGVFEPVSFTEAVLARRATLAEQCAYLALFPRVRLILCRREAQHWLAAPASRGDQRFRLSGLAQVELVEEAQAFDVVRAGFDGQRFWFDAVDPAQDAAAAAYLRQSLADLVDPDDIQRRRLTAEARLAYAVAYWKETEPEVVEEPAGRTAAPAACSPSPRLADAAARRLREHLTRAGAELLEYLEHRDSYRVTYVVDGQEFTSAVDKQDLSVVSAGVCLDGTDRQFDLQSLVGVLREGRRRGEIHRFE
jgi:hypothetical protein